MDIAARNRQVKQVLTPIFGRENVSVRNGKGTARGWCHIDIEIGKRLVPDGFYTDAERKLINEATDKAYDAIKHLEFYGYTDDMGYAHQEVIVQARLN